MNVPTQQRLKTSRIYAGFMALSLTLSALTKMPPAWGQTGNGSDITGVDLVETGTGTLQPTQETTEGAGFESDNKVIEERLTNPLTPAGEIYTLQTQSIINSYAQIFQSLDINLEGEEVAPETIALILRQLLDQTGNNAHYVQISVTEEGEVVITRIPSANPNAATSHRNPVTPTFLSHDFHSKNLNPKNFNPIDLNPLNLISNGQLKTWGKEVKDYPFALSQSPETSSNSIVSKYQVTGLTGEKTKRLIQQFRVKIQDSDTFHKAIGQRLYQLLIEPMETDLAADNADTIVLSLDSDLLGLPIQALNDGEKFLVEKYAVAVVPSFGLADIGYADIRQRSLLGMGSSVFKDQPALPAVPVELSTISTNNAKGRSLLNDQFTVNNFVRTVQETSQEGQRPGIIHLATHGDFAPGNYLNSYIQFNDRRVSLPEFRQIAVQLGWNFAETAPELLVLSACRTAIGDPTAELGFGGLAVASGAKTALASLWYVSDLGTLALMNEFYEALRLNPIKAQALQQAQLKLLKGSTQLRSGKLILSSGRVIELPGELAQVPDQDFSHPYYWSAFTLIGNWN